MHGTGRYSSPAQRSALGIPCRLVWPVDVPARCAKAPKGLRTPWNDRIAIIQPPQCLPIFLKSSRGTRVAIIAGPVSKRGDGSVGRCGDCATLCVFCVRRGLRRSGGVVRGRLRRPCRPLQVIGVLAVVLPIARKSLQFSPSAERAGRLPIPAKTNRQVRRTSARQDGSVLLGWTGRQPPLG